MEKLKNMHDHALTQWLKVIIFAILMMAPFVSVLSRCLYVTCNKNAKDSYSGIETSSAVNVYTSNLETGVTYTFVALPNLNGTNYAYVNVLPESVTNFVLNTNDTNVNYVIENSQYISRFKTYYDGTSTYIQFDFTVNNTFTQRFIQRTYIKSFDFMSLNDTTQSQYADNIYYISNQQYYYIDNAFEYSVNQLTQNQTFNWVTNTAIYQPVNAMTTGLGFDANNNIVALLLTYWAIHIAVYVLFDIIISCFVKITHLVGGSA